MISFERCITYSKYLKNTIIIYYISFSIPHEIGYNKHPYIIDPKLSKQLKLKSEKIEVNENLKDWPNHGKIVFENVFVKYRDPLEFALKNVTLKINPKEKVFKN